MRWKARYSLEYEKSWNDAKGNNQKHSYDELIACVADVKIKHTPPNKDNKEAISTFY